MARLFPFRALRYDSTRVNPADVVTQPYDKITPAMQEGYYQASPYNLIRVIFGKPSPQDTPADNVYTRAAAALSSWRDEGILQQEPQPAIYGYAQTYRVPGHTEIRRRRGFIALAQLSDYADHIIYRHEQTFPKHKSDRLALFRATRTYCEQIYMLYSDPTFAAENAIFTGRTPDLEITDEYDVIHSLFRVTDPVTISTVLAAMADKKLIIADGHHRYETSTTYMYERAAELGLDPKAPPIMISCHPEERSDEGPALPESATLLPAPAFPEQAMMMTFVNMDEPGITILPTHRVAFGLNNFSAANFITAAAEYVAIEELSTPSSAPELLQRLEDTPGTAFIAATREATYLLTPVAEKVDPLLSGLSPRQQQLDVTQLHKVVLAKLLGLDEDTVRAGNHVRYLREATDALDQVTSGDADIAFLIKPVTLDQMRDISLNLEVMPQKSTDFYPKLLSGLAMYTLD